MQMILFGRRNRGFADGRVAKMEAEHGIDGLTVNTEKKVMECQLSCMGEAFYSGNHLCSVLRQGVGCKSIVCVACHRWFHKKCSGISDRLRNIAEYVLLRKGC